MSAEALDVLRSIDASLKTLVRIAQKRQAQGPAAQQVASDRDLDGKHGNPEIKFNPRDWTGPSHKGRTMSECPAEFLEMVAETFDYFARQADEKDERTERGKPVADFKRADAARARGWAKRIREGTHTPPAPQPVAAGGGWDDSDAGGEWEAGGFDR